MKKSLKVIFIMAIIIALLCVNIKVFGVEPRTTNTEGEPVVTSDEPGDGVNPGDLARDDEQNVENNDYNNNIEIHEGDLYIISNEKNYVMDKNVDGNVFILGNDITIQGAINGSLFICANNFKIEENAYIGCHVFACANIMNINGAAYDMYLAGNEVNINETAVIGRDIKVTGNSIYLSGNVRRNASIAGTNVRIPEDTSKLNIMGKLDYSATQEITNLSHDSVKGEINFKKFEESEDPNEALDYVVMAVGTIVFDVVLYALLLLFAPKFINKAKEYVSTKGLLALVFGLVFTVIVPIISLMLIFTEVGVGLALLTILIYLTMLMINTFAVTTVLTEFVANKLNMSDDKWKKILLVIPVSLVIWILKKIPFIGAWISAIVFLCGIGIVIYYQFDKIRNKEA